MCRRRGLGAVGATACPPRVRRVSVTLTVPPGSPNVPAKRSCMSRP